MTPLIRQILTVAAILLIFLLAPILSGYDPLAVDTPNQLAAPSSAHPFGTDYFGRDVLSRFLHGGQRTLILAAAATALAISAAGGLRALSLIGGKNGESLVSMVSQSMLAVPMLPLALTVTTLLGRGEVGVIAAAGIAQIAPYLRTMLIAERQARVTGHVDAARAMGGTTRHIWATHIVPTMMPTLVAYAGVVFAQSLLTCAALGFLGFGGEISAPEWGRMLYEGRQVMRAAPWVALAPGFGITLLILLVNRQLGGLSVRPGAF